jgi:hypothetical protein
LKESDPLSIKNRVAKSLRQFFEESNHDARRVGARAKREG